MPQYRTVYFTRYIQTGIGILILTLTFLLCLTYKFKDPVSNMESYLTDVCMITNIEIRVIKFNCWEDGLARIVDIPCLRVTGNSINHKNISFYRSVTEKLYASLYQCSYLPTSCQHDTNFLLENLHKKLPRIFPPKYQNFNCFSSAPKLKRHLPYAILFQPDYLAFYIGFALAIFGILTSSCMILYGCSFICCKHKNESTRQKPRFIPQIEDYEAYHNNLKRILTNAHIDYEDYIVCQDILDSTFNTNITKEINGKNKIPRVSSTGNLSYRQHPDKVKLGSNEIRVGRIQPSLSKHGSLKSLASFSTQNLYSKMDGLSNYAYDSYSDTEL